MRKKRIIIHIDLDAFYCAVEELLDPSLKGKPIAVGGRPEGRGVISSCSYPARYFGVRSAMPTSKAILLCPDLIILPGHRKEYSILSREVMSILKSFSQRVEQISIDEAFLDFSDVKMDKKIVILAKNIQDRITKQTNLPCSLGIASNKMVAKIATDVGKSSHNLKSYPRAIQFVPHGNETTFLAPLPIEILWGIGEKTASQLHSLGIHTIGDLAQWPQNDLISRFSQHGYDLHVRSLGIDHREVTTDREAKSISQEITFSTDEDDIQIIHNQIKNQSKKISKNLKERNLLASIIKLKIRWPDFRTISRQLSLVEPISNEKPIFDAAIQLLEENWNHKHPIRLIGIGVSGLCPPSRQLSLWDQIDYERLGKLDAAIQKVKLKFGESSIQIGIDE